MTNDCVSAGEGVRLAGFVGAGARTALVAALAAGAAAQEFLPQQIASGAKIFLRNCWPCHGARMRDPEGAFDLHKFRHDAHDRFVT